MTETQQPPTRSTLRVVASLVVIAAGVYLLVRSAQNGDALGAAIGVLQAVAGAVMFVDFGRRRPSKSGEPQK